MVIENVHTIDKHRDKNLLETEYLIAICRQTGDNWQSTTLLLTIFDLRSLIAKSFFDCPLSGWCEQPRSFWMVKFSIVTSRNFLHIPTFHFSF